MTPSLLHTAESLWKPTDSKPTDLKSNMQELTRWRGMSTWVPCNDDGGSQQQAPKDTPETWGFEVGVRHAGLHNAVWSIGVYRIGVQQPGRLSMS